MEQQMTGYPSIDKPWLKYYSEEAVNVPLPEMTMYQYIWENNKDHLSDVALRYYGTKITYGNLFEQIKKATSAFYAMGVRKGDAVTIMSLHTPETIVCIYALNYIGAIANMVYMTLAEKEILHTLDNTESKMFFVLDAALERVNRIKGSIAMPVVVLSVAGSMPLQIKLGYLLKVKSNKHAFLTWNDFLSKGIAPVPMAMEPSVPAVIVYTSGSTGEPKGVVLGNDSLNTAVFQLLQSGKDYQRTDTFLSIIPPFLSYGILMLHEGLTIGLTSVLWLKHEPNSVAKELVRQKINRFAGSPDCVDALMKLGKINLSQLVDYTGGGDKLSPAKEVEINNFFRMSQASTKYLPAYGMTEFSACVALTTNEIYKSQSVGKQQDNLNKCNKSQNRCSLQR